MDGIAGAIPAGGAIIAFRGAYAFLSNAYDTTVRFEGADYPTVEHAYLAARTTDEAARAPVRRAATPHEARRLGYRLIPRDDWEHVRVTVMWELVEQKFRRHPEFAERLLATGQDVLVNGGGDAFWGVSGLRGANYLGRILMGVRAELAASPP